MELFVRVVETGSFTAAASALRLSRTRATTEIQALEGHLGVRLLQRTTRRVSPTGDGAVYYEEVRRLLRELRELEAGLAGAVASARGRLRVDVPRGGRADRSSPRRCRVSSSVIRRSWSTSARPIARWIWWPRAWTAWCAAATCTTRPSWAAGWRISRS